jgi:hypothetical protein
LIPAFTFQYAEALESNVSHRPAEGIEKLVRDELDFGAARLEGEDSRPD